MRADGNEPRRLSAAAASESFDALSWYPGTHRLAVVKSRKSGGQLLSELDTIDMAENRTTQAWSGDGVIALAALRGGRTIISRLESLAAQTSNLWQMQVDTATGRTESGTRQITDRAGKAIYELSASADGRRLAFLNSPPRTISRLPKSTGRNWPASAA
jgi:Tol biopolymer transport system component